MINKINTLRTVANNLTSHLFMEGKTKIKKPNVIIPGAAATAGVVLTLETKDNNANLIVEKDNAEVQRATFNYNETPNGYELVSAISSYFYDDKENKEIQQNHYLIEPENEKTCEHSINYQDAPIKKTTRNYIDSLNSSIAQISGYQSDKKDYDPQESHTYGKKSLKRDIPALLKILEIIAPDSEFTLKIKDKLKKDNKTSLVAFEASNPESGNGIVRGFMSTDGDSVSYRINTKDMIIIGEQSPNKDLSRTYLKKEKTVSEQNVITETHQAEQTNKTKAEKTSKIKNEEKKSKTKSPENIQASTISAETSAIDTEKKGKTDKQQTQNNVLGNKENSQTEKDSVHIYPRKYYTNLIIEAAKDKNLSPRKEAESFKETLALAYLDGYSKSELENILSKNGFRDISYYRRKAYVEAAVRLAEYIDTKQLPDKSLDNKIKELQNINIDIDDEDLKICIKNIITEITKIEDDIVKESYVDKTLNLLQNNSSNNFKSDLLSFVQEFSKINDDFYLQYEIFVESVNNKKIKTIKSKIEKMINNISDADYHGKRDEYLAQLYMTEDLDELKLLQNEVQKLLNEKTSSQKFEETCEDKQPQKLSIEDLSWNNQKIVRKLLNCKSPKDISLSFDQIKNLIEDIGFTPKNTKGTHNKYKPPIAIFFNGEKQSFFTLAYHSTKDSKRAQIDDLINICKQYYGSEK